MNWWKIGFFVMLFLFEAAREFAVLASDQSPEINTTADVYSVMGYVFVRGSWGRIDGKGRMSPTAVTIQCVVSDEECLEVTTSVYGNSVFAPEIDRFDATFTQDSVAYHNADPSCVSYDVRIDLKLKKTFAVRQKKADAKGELCKALENRVEMQLVDGFENQPSFSEIQGKHFVPLANIVSAIF